MINGSTPPNDWASLYLEPGIMKHVLHIWRQDGVPTEVPLIISESGIIAGQSGPGYLGATGRSIWEVDAFGTFFEQGGTAFYRPAINNGAVGHGLLDPEGGVDGGGAYGTPAYNPYSSAHIINFEWLQHEAGAKDFTGIGGPEGRCRTDGRYLVRRQTSRRELVVDADQP